MDGDGQPSDRSKPWWVIQDLCGDAVAVVEKPSASQAAAVAWQCTYEPYGGVLACRTLRAQAHSSFHKVLSGRLQSTFKFAGNTDARSVRELMHGMDKATLLQLRRVLYESTKTIEKFYPEAAGMTQELLREIRRQRWARRS